MAWLNCTTTVKYVWGVNIFFKLIMMLNKLYCKINVFCRKVKLLDGHLCELFQNNYVMKVIIVVEYCIIDNA